MAEPRKLEEADLARLREFVDLFNFLTKKLGESHFQLKMLSSDIQTIEAELDKNEKERIQLMSDLQKKYGQGSVNIGTGEFIPTEVSA